MTQGGAVQSDRPAHPYHDILFDLEFDNSSGAQLFILLIPSSPMRIPSHPDSRRQHKRPHAGHNPCPSQPFPSMMTRNQMHTGPTDLSPTPPESTSTSHPRSSTILQPIHSFNNPTFPHPTLHERHNNANGTTPMDSDTPYTSISMSDHDPNTPTNLLEHQPGNQRTIENINHPLFPQQSQHHHPHLTPQTGNLYHDTPHVQNRPFTGPLKAAIWNTQALFAHNAILHENKWAQVKKLIATHDIVFVSETHGTLGASRAMQELLDREQCTAFWTHGTRSRGGIGTIIKLSFLQQFHPTLPDDWTVLSTGRAAVLRLRGAHGNLDLAPLYLPTGITQRISDEADAPPISHTQQRQEIFLGLSQHLRPANTTLTLLGGDFNYVAHPGDRWLKSNATYSPLADHHDESNFQATLATPFSFHEIHQPHATHDCHTSRSKLDRFYINQHLADQLDTTLTCHPLQWNLALSHHRPVSFSRRRAPSRPAGTGPLPTQIIHQPDWPRRVAATFQHYQCNDTHTASPSRNMRLLKRAIQTVTWDMKTESNTNPPNTQPDHIDDALGWTMRCVRAVEKDAQTTINTCLHAYPTLHTMIGNRQAPKHLQLTQLKQHAVELAKLDILQTLRANSACTETTSDHDKINQRSYIQRKILRLTKGMTTGLGALQLPNGDITTDAETITTELRRHWSTVFAERHINSDQLNRWLEEEFPPAHDGGYQDAHIPPPTDPQWQITPEDIRRAIRHSPNTMPGPDGIPFLAWRRLGDLAVNTLYHLSTTLMQDNFEQQLNEAMEDPTTTQHDFNLSHLVLLPKKPTGHHNIYGDFYTAADTRPLNIVNTDNRNISNALRHKLEGILGSWVSPHQQGFLPHRSMLSNIVTIDHEAMCISLNHHRGGTMLFDFKAAFPSISHTYLHRVIEHLGFPRHITNAITALYNNNRCHITHHNHTYRGFNLSAGVRQGCPLSPLLFATTIDLLLRRLHRTIPNITITAFADDIATTFPDSDSALLILADTFHQFASISGMELNKPKTEFIPLWIHDTHTIHTYLAHNIPYFNGINIATAARYLGIYIGPTSSGQSWHKPLAKYLQRARLWGQQGIGLYHATICYQLFALSTLTFVSQLEYPPPQAQTIEQQALRLSTPGPAHWILPDDLYHLKQLGQRRNFPSLTQLSIAAKHRVATWENSEHGGLHVHERIKELERAFHHTEHYDRRHQWHDWYRRSFPITLQHASNLVHALQLPVRCPRHLALPWQPLHAPSPNYKSNANTPPTHSPSTPPTHPHRHQHQNYVSQALQQRVHYNVTERIRHKMQRWKIQDLPPRVLTDRVTTLLSTLSTILPPKVTAAVLRTLFNGWTTARRSQRIGCCVFGCSPTAHDSLEHYATCPTVHTFGRKWLGLPHHDDPLQRRYDFITLGAHQHRSLDPDITIRKAIRIYATYRAVLTIKHSDNLSPQTASELLPQYARMAAMGHRRSTRSLVTWPQYQRSQHHHSPHQRRHARPDILPTRLEDLMDQHDWE